MIADITAYGAVGDGRTVNTQVLQNAVDACAAAGGGTVVVPPGTFVTGTVFLKSHITLALEAGAVLRGSPDLADYCTDDAYPQNWPCPAEGWCGAHLIAAVEQEDVRITGPGTIDGNCEAFLMQHREEREWLGGLAWARGFRNTDTAKYPFRPGQMVVFIQCRNIRVENVNLRNSPCWSCFLHGCSNAILHGLNIDNPVDCANSDGIDIDCCKCVTVSDCIIRTGDDAITLRASGKKLTCEEVCEDIAITNCVLDSSVCGFRIGVGRGTIRNAAISNIIFRHAGHGFLLQSSFSTNGAGVTIEDLNISNIRGHHIGEPLLIQAGMPDTGKAQIRNIRISDFHVECAGGIAIIGNAVNRPDRIVLDNCSFDVVKFEHPYKPEKAPTAFLHCEHAGRITLRNTELCWHDPNPEWKAARRIADVDALRETGCDFPELKV